MEKIIQLDQLLINKIAAGEVVERPLSVVKELTENSIDANATAITVEIRDGGLTSIRVSDNGAGISPENLPLAFARHATSKITTFDDLTRVQTLGFRGEALSSIAAVAQVEMITKIKNFSTGTRVEVHGGKIISNKEIGCADGTSITVSNLFFNTPARRKFLKKPAVEAGYISHCLERLALGNPSLTIKYINNGQIVFQTTGNGDLKTTLLNIYGREVATKTATVDAKTDGDLHLFGLIGKPEIARGNRRHGSFFINGRNIENKLITRAVESAMKTMLPSGKFPIYALNLAMPHDALDVNVHPTKMDVRFTDEEGIFAFVEDAVRDALEEHNLIPKIRFSKRAGDFEAQAEQLPLYAKNETSHEEFDSGISKSFAANEKNFLEKYDANEKKFLKRFDAGEKNFLGKYDAKEKNFLNKFDTGEKNFSEKFAANEKNLAQSLADEIFSFLPREDRSNEIFRMFSPENRADEILKFPMPEDFADENKKFLVSEDFTDENKKFPMPENFAHENKKFLMPENFASEIPKSPPPKKIFEHFQIIGLIFQTYWLVSQDESLFVIDRHAAHERVLYEQILRRAQDETVHAQNLLVPISLRITPREKQILRDNKEIFSRFGFEIADESEHPEILSVPLLMNDPVSADFFTDLLDKMGDAGFSYESPYAHKTEIIAMAACKAAVKAGDNMHDDEARTLIEQLFELENPFTCPHGRPTIIEITKGEFERRFKR